MTDDGAPRPRRGIAPDADEADDTPTVVLYTPRRGGGDDAGPVAESPTSPTSASPVEPEAPAEQTGVNPRAYFGSSWDAVTSTNLAAQSADPNQAASDPEVADSATPERSQWRPAKTEADSPVPPPSGDTLAMPVKQGYQPRRSATSALSPTEPEPTGSPSARAERTQSSWARVLERFGFWRTYIVVACLVGLLLVGGILFAMFNPGFGTPAPSSSPIATGTPPITTKDLLEPSDITGLGGSSAWFASQTLTSLDASAPQPACLTAVSGSTPARISLQRTLETEDSKTLALLQQLDYFDAETTAKTVFGERAAVVAACNDSQSLIVSSTQVTGLGDEALQLTVAYQLAAPEYHTLLLVRSGSVISTFDVAKDESAVEVDALVKVAATSLDRVCVANGSCPTDPKASPALPPATDPIGWLIGSDLPRITAGTGRWTGTDPTDLTALGTQCEGVTLASVTGPTERQQRSFLLTQDDAVPDGYGADEMLFTFKDKSAASEFVKTLNSNISKCPDDLLTAEVSDKAEFKETVADVTVSGTSYTIKQVVTKQTVIYQVVLAQVDKRVVYFVTSYISTDANTSFGFTKDQLAAVGVRAGDRASQAS